MIPQKIHYCWFGHSPLPKLAQKCISSWRKYLPDYEIIEWNEDNFDVNIIPYTAEAYKAKKYAFVSDYARFWILYKYGGLYFDTDVEVIKPMDGIISNGSFMACEEDGGVNTHIVVAPGLGLGCPPCLMVYDELLKLYSSLSFINQDGTINNIAIVKYTTDLLRKYGLKEVSTIQNIEGITIYPKEYFCPKSWKTKKINITDKTVCIHHYDGSWLPRSEKIKNMFNYKMKGVLKVIRSLFKS